MTSNRLMVLAASLALSFPLAACAHAQTAAPPTPFDAPRRVDLAAPVVVVPLAKDGAFYFASVRINGRPFRFTIETGANFVAISGAAARALGVPIDSVELPGVGGPTPRAPVVHLDSIAVGGATFRGLTARVNPAWDTQGFDGIVSVPYFQHLLVGLELAKSRLTFRRGTLPAPNGRDVVPLARRDRAGRIDVDVDVGGVSLPVVVDTRSYLPLMLPDSLAGGLRTEAAPRAIGSAMGPSQGTFTLRGARLTGPARIGSVTVARPPIAFRDRPGAVIGVPLLEQLDLTFDLAHDRVRVAAANGGVAAVPPQAWEGEGAGAPASARTSGQRTMGFNLAGFPGTSELRVLNLAPGSDAARAGLRNDDTVLEFDGTPVAQMNQGVFRAAVARDTPTKIVVLRGTERLTFSVRPYVVP